MTTAYAGRLEPPAAAPPTAPDVREAALRPFGRPGRGYWLLLITLAAVVVLGLVAWVIQLRRGLDVAGYNDHAFWAIYIADVVTFIGVSYGGAVISAVLRLTGASWRAPLSRIAEGMAVVTVLIGGAFIIPHLGRPERIWELVTRPNLSSPIFWDFVAVSTYTIGSIVFFTLPLFPDMAILHRAHRDRLGHRARVYAAVSRGWAGTPRQRSVLRGALGLVSIMIIPLAVSVHSVLSWAFALVSRPWWHESIWAPYFVVAALYSGVALVILVVAGFRRGYHLEPFITERHFVRLGFIMAAFAAAYIYLTFADILPDAYTGEPGPTVVFRELLLGHFAVWFWTFVVAAGLLPLLLVAIPRTRTIPGMVVAAAFVVPAMWLKRMLMVADPATYDRITHTFGAFHFTWISVSITLAGLAAIPLLLMLLFRVVPLLSIDEIEETGEIGEPEPEDVKGREYESARSSAGKPLVPAAEQETGFGAAAAAPARRRAARRWPFRLAGATGLAALVVGVVALASAPRASAATVRPQRVGPAVIRLTGTDGADGLRLAATLTDARGTPVAGATVLFYERTTEFGPSGQLVPLGRGVTDRSGAAGLTDQPAVTGIQQFVASYAGGTRAGQASATVAVNVTTARSPYQPSRGTAFAGIGKALAGVLLTAVALILLTMLAQVERVRRASRAGG